MTSATLEVSLPNSGSASAGDRESTVSRFIASGRRHGFIAAISRIGYRALVRVLKLDVSHVLHLDGAAAAATSARHGDGPFEFRFLTSDEVRRFAEDPTNDLDPAMASRIDGGTHFCFAAVHGSRLANYSWYSLVAPEDQDAKGIELQIRPGTAYLYKAYTHPNYRGRKLHGATVSQARRVLIDHGVRDLLCFVEFGNWASSASHREIGFRRLGSVVAIGEKFRFRRAASGQRANFMRMMKA